MNLTIDTSDREIITLILTKGEVIIDQKIFPAHRQQAEKLLPEVEKLLKKNRQSKNDLKKILVADTGGSFTSLRIGIVTANALAYALKIPIEALHKQPLKQAGKIKIVSPRYSQEPLISKKKQK